MIQVTNPILRADFPDLDIIRVGGTYYMVSTTMHFMPGGVILKSYDLAHWEICSYLYEKLGDTDGQNLNGGAIYGAGMWAASLRYHNGLFYICFVANDTHKTYLVTTPDIENGPYTMRNIEGFYHDCSLLFDDDGRVYIAYGGGRIRLTELKPDLSAPMPGGLDRIIVTEKERVGLPYEGTHLYKINGKYYAFFIHWLAEGSRRRVEACFVADSLDGEWRGGNVFDCAADGRADGIAQGGIVDTPDGETYAMLFQDHGALGRIPYLVPVRWENDFPVFDTEHFMQFSLPDGARPDYRYAPVVSSDSFDYLPDEEGSIHLSKVWQWNHNPHDAYWSISDGRLTLTTDRVVSNPTAAVNTLTQRTLGEVTDCVVTVDGGALGDGDYAGLLALQGNYGAVCLTKEGGLTYVVMLKHEEEQRDYRQQIVEKRAMSGTVCRLRVVFDFTGGKDEATFYMEDDGGKWSQIGTVLKMRYTLDHFAGYRVALCCYSTEKAGGKGAFSDFRYFANGEEIVSLA